MRSLWGTSWTWWVSAAASVYVTGCIWFMFDLTAHHPVGSFLAFMAGLPVGVVGLACSLAVLLGLARRRPLAGVTLVALNAVAVWSVLQGDAAYDRGRDWDFQQHLEERERVVRMVEAGALEQESAAVYAPPPQRRLRLPAGLRHLSGAAGHVTVWEEGGATHVLFPQSHTFDSFAGFVYRSDGRPPVSPPALTFLQTINFSERLAERWWWAGGVY